MNKSKMLAMIIGVLILCESLGLIYFAYKAQILSRKNKVMAVTISGFQPGYTKMSESSQEAMARYKATAKELEAIKADRENILAQTKSLLANRMRAQELEEELNKVKASVQTIEGAQQKTNEQNLVLKAHIKKIKKEQAALTAERDELKSAYEKLQNNTLVKELNNKMAGLQKELKDNVAGANTEKAKVASDLKAAEKKIVQLTEQNNKLTVLKKEWSDKIQAQEKNYAEAVKKNKAFEQEIKDMPSKFVEVSRQNTVLLKETAGMHYNLGVFYIKNKEYDRAAVELKKTVEINPDDAYAHFNLGYIYAEYLVNRKKATEHFRHFLRLTKGNDPDVDWARKYLLTWETYEGKRPMQ